MHYFINCVITYEVGGFVEGWCLDLLLTGLGFRVGTVGKESRHGVYFYLCRFLQQNKTNVHTIQLGCHFRLRLCASGQHGVCKLLTAIYCQNYNVSSMSVVFNRCRTCCSRFLTMFWLAQATLFYKNLQLLQQNDVIHKTSKKRGIQVFVNRYTSRRHRYILAMFVRLTNTTSKSLYVNIQTPQNISIFLY